MQKRKPKKHLGGHERRKRGNYLRREKKSVKARPQRTEPVFKKDAQGPALKKRKRATNALPKKKEKKLRCACKDE